MNIFPDALNHEELATNFVPDEVIMPRWWSDGFVNEEARAEIIDAVRNIIWNSSFLSKKLPTLKCHLMFTQMVLNYLMEHSLDSEVKEIFAPHLSDGASSCERGRTDLFLKVVAACSALASLNLTEMVENISLPVCAFDIGLVVTKNRRRLMEDQMILLPLMSLWPSTIKMESQDRPHNNCALLAVMDGHGGQHASSYVARHFPDIVFHHLSTDLSSDLQHVLEESIADVERMFCARASRLGQVRVGTTLVTALIDLESGHGSISWLGDSRADLFKFRRQDGALRCEIVNLTVPLHRPDNDVERKRIESVGGFVSGSVDTVARVNGQLGISRSIGDLEYKLAGLVSAEAQFSSVHLPATQDQDNHNKFEVLLLSSDGLWDGLSGPEIGSVISESLKRESYRNDPDWLSSIASRLSAAASEKSDDNITCILIARPPVHRLSRSLLK